jgi:hypothetical protein
LDDEGGNMLPCRLSRDGGNGAASLTGRGRAAAAGGDAFGFATVGIALATRDALEVHTLMAEFRRSRMAWSALASCSFRCWEEMRSRTRLAYSSERSTEALAHSGSLDSGEGGVKSRVWSPAAASAQPRAIPTRCG